MGRIPGDRFLYQLIILPATLMCVVREGTSSEVSISRGRQQGQQLDKTIGLRQSPLALGACHDLSGKATAFQMALRTVSEPLL